RDQRIDAVMAVARHQRVDVFCVSGPVRGEHLAAAVWGALVPQFNIAVGNLLDVGHLLVSFESRIIRLIRTIGDVLEPIDYLRRHVISYGAIFSTAFMLGW